MEPLRRVVVGSTNPVKVNCVQKGFETLFPEWSSRLQVEGISVKSGIADQPMSDSECFKGAQNRAKECRKIKEDCDFWVGVEGGVEWDDTRKELVAFAWVVILQQTPSGCREGVSKTATFSLPDEVAQLVRGGMELGQADDVVFSRTNSKQKSGACGILTRDCITRTLYYQQAVILALIPARNPSLYT